ncbi:unnamed protein product, partial [Prorocentrum cordatum]
ALRGEPRPLGGPALLSAADAAAAQRGARAHVRFPRRLLAVVAELRAFLRAGAQPPFLASDRRLARAVRLLRVAAFAEGSDSVGELHLLLLQHMLWGQHPSLCGEVRAWLLARLARGAGGGGPATAPELQLLVDGARGRLASRGAVAGALADLSGLRASLERQLVARLGLRGRLRPRLEAASGGLWLTGPELEEARSAMLPRLDASVAEAERLLQQVLELEAVAKVEDDALRRGCLEMEALKFGRSSGDGDGILAGLPFDVTYLDNPVVSKVVRGVSGGFSTVAVHSTAEFARQHINTHGSTGTVARVAAPGAQSRTGLPESVVLEALFSAFLAAAKPFLGAGLPEPRFGPHLHRWSSAFPGTALPGPVAADGVCLTGDFVGEPTGSVEAAMRGGVMGARALFATCEANL